MAALRRLEEDEAMARAIDRARYDALKAQALSDREIAQRWEILWDIFHREKQKREAQATQAHPGVPMSAEVAVRLLSLLPDLEVLVALERDRQRLLSTPVGTPRHTVKKTYVVETLYIDLIERYAKDKGIALKDVVHLAFHEFFERRDYLPQNAKEAGGP
jgi:hypothetical protein